MWFIFLFYALEIIDLNKIAAKTLRKLKFSCSGSIGSTHVFKSFVVSFILEFFPNFEYGARYNFPDHGRTLDLDQGHTASRYTRK